MSGVIAMKVKSSSMHPNAPNLRVLQLSFKPSGAGNVTVVTNTETFYQTGDIVAMAEAGALLIDGTLVPEGMVFGIYSQGMVLGVVEAKVMDSLTNQFCHPAYAQHI